MTARIFLINDWAELMFGIEMSCGKSSLAKTVAYFCQCSTTGGTNPFSNGSPLTVT